MHICARVGSAALLSLVVMACGGENEAHTPVAAVPLSGTVRGQPFTAVSAIAYGFEDPDVPDNTLIQISEAQLDCGDLGALTEGRRDFTLAGPWTVHTEPLSLQNILSAVVYRNGQPDSSLVVSGLVEFVETPPEVGALGKVRLRGISSQVSVEGEVSVKFCGSTVPGVGGR
ncbi:hypothetical protein [Stigmatella erecta]|uniref:Lipoprotein n=1 Tax=Stigmatella erecta TaxID=83460 RepID=A0A1I0IQT0_9BACT|nr:hypothetical protein [Stigmatella erecta]SET99565.1 hypothetical protein SAMN05443639_106222 [Stigmatella erecta]